MKSEEKQRPMKFIEALRVLQQNPGLHFMYRTDAYLNWLERKIDLRYIDNKIFLCKNGKAMSDAFNTEWLTSSDWLLGYTKDSNR